MQEQSFIDLVKDYFPFLSPGQKKVAECILHEMDHSVLLTAFQLGQRVGVSETTVIRLAYTLGFNGYSHMQEAIRKNWLVKKTTASNQTHEDPNESSFQNQINQEIKILQLLSQNLDHNNISQALNLLVKSERIFIGAFGSSFAAGYWLEYHLKQLRPNVILSHPYGFTPQDILEINKESVALLFSYPRYRKETIRLANCFKKQQTKIIAITSDILSPVAQLADITLVTENNIGAGHHSIASVISFLEILITGFEEKVPEASGRRQQKLESIYHDQDLFIE
ncbi:MurR/RpiR family transcriptional regulator [Alkalihalophilus lindianensis]|uniref:MurR/RpiR family transcriptional regulator n=1 Tax=Alkalihalophilus lindianensis TaxID=1630542 RepID=A0ABU3X9U3_9BACI|nr:MurR/RpiR family transcriptional regulator [Alkalihalophilus lindianensis]MDV2684078.1 MurR/RpiR family transcriptional regulator [Alkalihalophilus lindianensis]